MERASKDAKDPLGQDRLVLQLNRPALERLIGGDTEVETRLRHQIVNEFAKKHLKAVATDPAFAAIIESHRKVIDAEVRNLVGEYVWKDGKSVAVLRERVAKLVNDSVDEIIADVVKRNFEKIIEHRKEELDDYIRRTENKLISDMRDRFIKTKNEFDKTLNSRIDQFFEERVQAEAKRRLETAAKMTEPAVTTGNPTA